MKRALLTLTTALALAIPVRAGDVGDPSAVNIKMLAGWVSSHADCSDPVAVFSTPGATYQNMLTGPTFGSGTIANGTYPCVIFKVSDDIRATSGYNSTDGGCVDGNSYSGDIFREGDTSNCPDGVVTGVTNAVGTEQHPCIFFSANSSGAGHGFGAGNEAIPMSAPWVVSGDTDATFVMNFTGKMLDQLNNGSRECGIDPPVISFH